MCYKHLNLVNFYGLHYNTTFCNKQSLTPVSVSKT